MTTRSLSLPTLVFLAIAPSAKAQDSVSVDPSVSAVVSGGRWTAEGRSGFYRVIIRTGGLQHTGSDLTVQWLSDPARDGLPAIVRSMGLKELDGVGRLDRPQLGKYLKGWRLWIQVTETRSSPGAQSTRAVDLGPPGEARVRPPS